ncbi:UNVERIFIED_CONTAM: hypothetical protein HDU68_005904, partial [Siphonaria sp. JEL0065]
MRIEAIRLDGDCGFQSVGLVSGENGRELRAASNRIINVNERDFRAEIAPETVSQYTHRMAKFAVAGVGGHMGEFCESPSIAAMAVYLCRIIIVYEDRAGERMLERTFTPTTVDASLPSLTIYNSFERQHYEALVPILPTPPVTPVGNETNSLLSALVGEGRTTTIANKTNLKRTHTDAFDE